MSNNKFNLTLKQVYAYEVLDSRGYPTIACVVKLNRRTKAFSNGRIFGTSVDFTARAMVPSGASTGQKEALELRDNDPNRYNGKGVKQAVNNVNDSIGPKLIAANLKLTNQKAVDDFLISLDGTVNKSRYGANALLVVSLAVAKVVAKALGLPLYKYVAQMVHENNQNYVMPLPMVNVINGGEHADNSIDFQEFMFMPVGAKSLHQALRMSSECFHALQKILHKKGYNTAKGDEGGFAPNLSSAEEAISYMLSAIYAAGYTPGITNGQVAIALDCASSELYDKEKGLYVFKKAIASGNLSAKEGTKTTAEMIDYMEHLVDKFPIISIEDALDETDWEGWKQLNERLGARVQLVGDDLFCTNPNITQEGIDYKIANSVLIKVNQIGTLSETLQTIGLAKNANWTWVLSHRSGETEDTTIADLAVGTNSGQIKTGSMSRSERLAKYNRLIEIELELGDKAVFKGLDSFTNLNIHDPILFPEHDYSKYENYNVSSSKPKKEVQKQPATKKTPKPESVVKKPSTVKKLAAPKKPKATKPTETKVIEKVVYEQIVTPTVLPVKKPTKKPKEKKEVVNIYNTNWLLKELEKTEQKVQKEKAKKTKK